VLIFKIKSYIYCGWWLSTRNKVMENKEKWNNIRKIGKRQDENRGETENVS
jgi:hypothetical protein